MNHYGGISETLKKNMIRQMPMMRLTHINVLRGKTRHKADLA